MTTRRAPPILVGWNELVDLPEWGVFALPAKIDTGARSSSLHVEGIEELAPGRIRFHLPHVSGRDHADPWVEAPITRIARVTSSNGLAQKRLFVSTCLQLGTLARAIELNLVDRGDMRFPMLIGRSALAKRYRVDPGKRRLTR